MKNSNKAIYRVNIIRSQRANEREGYEHPTLEKHIGDYDSLEEATTAYNAEQTGMETEKELLSLTDNDSEVIETTF